MPVILLVIAVPTPRDRRWAEYRKGSLPSSLYPRKRGGENRESRVLSVGVGTPIHPPPGAGAALLTHSQADGAQTSWWELEELLPGFAPPPAVPELGAVQQQVASKKFCNRITRKETGACGGMAMIISDTSRAWREGAARLSHPPAAWACRLLPGLSFASRSSVFGAQCWEGVWLCKARLWGQI